MDRRETRRTFAVGTGLLALVLTTLGLSYMLNAASRPSTGTDGRLAQAATTPTIGSSQTAMTPHTTPTPPPTESQRVEDAGTQTPTPATPGTPRTKASSWDPGSGTPFEPRMRPTEPAVPPDVPPAGTTATPESPINTNGVEEMRQWIKGDRPGRMPYYNAYINYWQIASEAYRTGDPSRLGEVMTGDALDAARKSIAERRAQGRGVETRIRTKSFAIVDLKPNMFSIQHQYINASMYVDLQTGQPIVTGEHVESSMYKQLTVLHKVDGRWKVSSINLTQVPTFTP